MNKFIKLLGASLIGACLFVSTGNADDVTEAATRAAQAAAKANEAFSSITDLGAASSPSDTYEFVVENGSSPGTLESMTFKEYANYILEENRPVDLVAETTIADTDVFLIDDGTGTAPKKITALDMDTRFGGGSGGVSRPDDLTADTDVVDADKLMLDDGTGAEPKSITAELLADYMEAEINIGASSALVNNDITEAPYNATCNGVADDSNAFESAVGDGGVFFLPPGSDCVLNTTSSHSWSTDTIFYGLHGAARDTQIDLSASSGTMFSLDAGASVGLYNISFYNGANADFINANGLNGIVDEVVCAWTYWTNTNTVCVRWSEDSDAADGGEINKYWFLYNTVDNTGTASAENLFVHGGALRSVQVVGNNITGGKRGVRMGFVEDDDNTSWVGERERILIAHNTVFGIDGNDTTGGTTVACLKAMGTNVVISDNICKDVQDPGAQSANTECVYTKAQEVVIANNNLEDCGSDQAVIALKGHGEAITGCTEGACAISALVIGNTLKDIDNSNNALNCIHVQSQNAMIVGNSIEGCSLSAINVVQSGPYRNTKISENKFYGLFGRTTGSGAAVRFQVNNTLYNCQVNDNMFTEFDTSGESDFELIRFEIANGETVNRCIIDGNSFPYSDGGEALSNVKIENDGTFNDLEFKNNSCGDADICVEITGSGTMNEPTYMGNTFHDSTTSYSEAAGQTVNNCFEDYNRDWGTPTSDSC